jgi:phosphoribosylanthranilate isomerase
MRIKICGITNQKDAEAATEAGADYLGFILYPPSPRGTTAEDARRITDSLKLRYGDECPFFVGVFVNETVASITQKMATARLDLAQLSGDESAHVLTELQQRAYKAIQPRTVDEAIDDVQFFAPLGPPQEHHPEILVDGYHPHLRGGTGEITDPFIAHKAREYSPRMMLAGGLNPENIAEQIRIIQPFAVDVASGVEAEKGIKDHDRLRAFIDNARAAAEEIES